jgi:hypothetical protein
MEELVELEDFLNRSNWLPRAATTRWRIAAETPRVRG